MKLKNRYFGAFLAFALLCQSSTPAHAWGWNSAASWASGLTKSISSTINPLVGALKTVSTYVTTPVINGLEHIGTSVSTFARTLNKGFEPYKELVKNVHSIKSIGVTLASAFGTKLMYDRFINFQPEEPNGKATLTLSQMPDKLPYWLENRQDLPKTIFLQGESGSGKTFLAHAIANELSINRTKSVRCLRNLFSIKASDLMTAIPSIAALQLDCLIAKAQMHADKLVTIDDNFYTVIFIDEVHILLQNEAIKAHLLTLLSEFSNSTSVHAMESIKSVGNVLDKINRWTSLPSFKPKQKDGKLLIILATDRPNEVDHAVRQPGRVTVVDVEKLSDKQYIERTQNILANANYEFNNYKPYLLKGGKSKSYVLTDDLAKALQFSKYYFTIRRDNETSKVLCPYACLKGAFKQMHLNLAINKKESFSHQDYLEALKEVGQNVHQHNFISVESEMIDIPKVLNAQQKVLSNGQYAQQMREIFSENINMVSDSSIKPIQGTFDEYGNLTGFTINAFFHPIPEDERKLFLDSRYYYTMNYHGHPVKIECSINALIDARDLIYKNLTSDTSVEISHQNFLEAIKRVTKDYSQQPLEITHERMNYIPELEGLDLR